MREGARTNEGEGKGKMKMFFHLRQGRTSTGHVQRTFPHT